jgi:hypothetical protein
MGYSGQQLSLRNFSMAPGHLGFGGIPDPIKFNPCLKLGVIANYAGKHTIG